MNPENATTTKPMHQNSEARKNTDNTNVAYETTDSHRKTNCNRVTTLQQSVKLLGRWWREGGGAAGEGMWKRRFPYFLGK